MYVYVVAIVVFQFDLKRRATFIHPQVSFGTIVDPNVNDERH